MEDGIFEKIKSNNKEMKKIKVKMAILKYFQIIIGISAGTAFLQNAANWFSFGFVGGLILNFSRFSTIWFNWIYYLS